MGGLRIGIVGIGQGVAHPHSFRSVPDIQVVALCDSDEQSSIDAALADQHAIRFRASCANPDGLIVKVPVEQSAVGAVLVDGTPVPHVMKKRAAGFWAYAIVPIGEHEIVVAITPQ